MEHIDIEYIKSHPRPYISLIWRQHIRILLPLPTKLTPLICRYNNILYYSILEFENDDEISELDFKIQSAYV